MPGMQRHALPLVHHPHGGIGHSHIQYAPQQGVRYAVRLFIEVQVLVNSGAGFAPLGVEARYSRQRSQRR